MVMDPLQSLQGQYLFAVSFALGFIEFRFLPPNDSPIIIEFNAEREPDQSEPATNFYQADSYIPPRIDDAVLRVYTRPRLSANGRQLTYPGPGSRDAFCALLDASVQDILHRPASFIQVTFTEGQQLEIPLRGKEHVDGPGAVFEHRGVAQVYW